MSISRVLPLAIFLVLSATAGARADSFDGVYVNGDGGNVAYFDLLRHNDRISGTYTVVVRNPDTSGGILRSHFTVTGTADRRGALLTIVGETPESQAAMSYRWISRAQRDGFSVEIPVETGHISTSFFRAGSVAGVNDKLAVLTSDVDRELRIRLDKLALVREEQSLHADLAARLQAFSAVVKASSDLDRARVRRQTLQATVADLARESERRHRLTIGTNAAVPGRTSHQRLIDLQDQANYSDYALAAAKSDALGASQQVASATQTLQVAKQNLIDHDTRIAALLAVLVRGSAPAQPQR
jgi:hypothetical protein